MRTFYIVVRPLRLSALLFQTFVRSDVRLIVFELQLWMGTHKKGESRVIIDKLPLSQWLSEHPDAMGADVAQHFSSTSQLPFLFKVLSVAKSLSIQAHPNKVWYFVPILYFK